MGGCCLHGPGRLGPAVLSASVWLPGSCPCSRGKGTDQRPAACWDRMHGAAAARGGRRSGRGCSVASPTFPPGRNRPLTGKPSGDRLPAGVGNSGTAAMSCRGTLPRQWSLGGREGEHARLLCTGPPHFFSGCGEHFSSAVECGGGAAAPRGLPGRTVVFQKPDQACRSGVSAGWAAAARGKRRARLSRACRRCGASRGLAAPCQRESWFVGAGVFARGSLEGRALGSKSGLRPPAWQTPWCSLRTGAGGGADPLLLCLFAAGPSCAIGTWRRKTQAAVGVQGHGGGAPECL